MVKSVSLALAKLVGFLLAMIGTGTCAVFGMVLFDKLSPVQVSAEIQKAADNVNLLAGGFGTMALLTAARIMVPHAAGKLRERASKWLAGVIRDQMQEELK